MKPRVLISIVILFILHLKTSNSTTIIPSPDVFPGKVARCGNYDGANVRKSEPKTRDDFDIGMSILQRTKCGKREGELITQETNIQILEYPWMVLLEYGTVVDGIPMGVGCDGSLITERYVLTTAACLLVENKKPINVILGEYNSDTQLDCIEEDGEKKCAPPVQTIEVAEAIYHKDYDPKSVGFNGDIGLLRLKEKAIFRSNVRPICLPITPYAKMAQKEWLTIAGWDRLSKEIKSTTPFKEIVPTIETSECYGIHIFIDINDNHMCVGEDEVTNLYCKGDSGTPMFTMAPYSYGGKPRFIQYGIVSPYGSFCNAKLPHIYVNVTTYMPWIAENIRY